MIPALALKFLALPKPVRYGIAVVAGALLLWGAWSLWIWQHDRSIVRKHDAEQRAVVTEKVLEAERGANARSDVRRRQLAEQTKRLQEAREEALHDNPEPVLAGPATRAVLAELRRQAAQPQASD